MNISTEQRGAAFTMLVERALPDGGFVVTNSSGRDIPKGTTFIDAYAERGTLDPNAEGHFVVRSREQGPVVALRLDDVEFFRRSIECVPCGHHAGVQFTGNGSDQLRDFLHSHPRPWLVSLASEPLKYATIPSVCERIATARGGDLIVRIEDIGVATPLEAARLFGLFESPEIYFEVSEAEAKSVLVAVLVKDMAYGSPLVPPGDAVALADAFFGSFAANGARYFTNGEFGKPRLHPNIGPSWNPATEHTFDSGVLILSPRRIGCAWFMDED